MPRLPRVVLGSSLVLLVSALAPVGGCGGGDPSLVIASLVAAPGAVRVGGRSTVTARIERNGEPAAGYGVGFTIADTSVAHFTSGNAAATNAAGEASVEVIGVATGTTEIVAKDITTPSSTAQRSVTLTVQRVTPASATP